MGQVTLTLTENEIRTLIIALKDRENVLQKDWDLVENGSIPEDELTYEIRQVRDLTGKLEEIHNNMPF